MIQSFDCRFTPVSVRDWPMFHMSDHDQVLFLYAKLITTNRCPIISFFSCHYHNSYSSFFKLTSTHTNNWYIIISNVNLAVNYLYQIITRETLILLLYLIKLISFTYEGLWYGLNEKLDSVNTLSCWFQTCSLIWKCGILVTHQYIYVWYEN